MSKKVVFYIFTICVIFFLIGKYKQYSLIILGIFVVYILFRVIIDLTKKPIKKVYTKTKTVLIAIEDVLNSEQYNMILILKDLEKDKYYQIPKKIFSKPSIGANYYLNVNVNDEEDYYLLSASSNQEDININPLLIAVCFLIIGFILFLLIEYMKA